jgi:hypothetical protein
MLPEIEAIGDRDRWSLEELQAISRHEKMRNNKQLYRKRIPFYRVGVIW